MASATDLFVVTVGLFAVVGLALGTLGFMSAGVAQTQFVDQAGGAAEEFGVAFLSVVHFGFLSAVLFLSPVLAGAVGVLSGSQLHDRLRAGAVAGGGSLVGAALLVGIAVPVLNAGSEVASAPFVGEPVLLAVGIVLTGVVGTIAGVLGSLLY